MTGRVIHLRRDDHQEVAAPAALVCDRPARRRRRGAGRGALGRVYGMPGRAEAGTPPAGRGRRPADRGGAGLGRDLAPPDRGRCVGADVCARPGCADRGGLGAQVARWEASAPHWLRWALAAQFALILLLTALRPADPPRQAGRATTPWARRRGRRAAMWSSSSGRTPAKRTCAACCRPPMRGWWTVRPRPAPMCCTCRPPSACCLGASGAAQAAAGRTGRAGGRGGIAVIRRSLAQSLVLGLLLWLGAAGLAPAGDAVAGATPAAVGQNGAGVPAPAAAAFPPQRRTITGRAMKKGRDVARAGGWPRAWRGKTA